MPKSSTESSEADRRKSIEHRSRAVDVGHDRALGDLQADGARIDLVLPGEPLEVVRKLEIEKIDRGEIDRELELGAEVLPAPDLPERELEHRA